MALSRTDFRCSMPSTNQHGVSARYTRKTQIAECDYSDHTCLSCEMRWTCQIHADGTHVTRLTGKLWQLQLLNMGNCTGPRFPFRC